MINYLKNKSKNEKYNFCFRNGLNYTLSKDGKVAEKTSGGNRWNCSIIGNRELPKNQISKWKIRLNTFILNKTINFVNTFIGIGPDNPENKEYFYDKCWSLSLGEPKILIKDNKIFIKKRIKFNFLNIFHI